MVKERSGAALFFLHAYVGVQVVCGCQDFKSSCAAHGCGVTVEGRGFRNNEEDISYLKIAYAAAAGGYGDLVGLERAVAAAVAAIQFHESNAEGDFSAGADTTQRYRGIDEPPLTGKREYSGVVANVVITALNLEFFGKQEGIGTDTLGGSVVIAAAGCFGTGAGSDCCNSGFHFISLSAAASLSCLGLLLIAAAALSRFGLLIAAAALGCLGLLLIAAASLRGLGLLITSTSLSGLSLVLFAAAPLGCLGLLIAAAALCVLDLLCHSSLTGSIV